MLGYTVCSALFCLWKDLQTWCIFQNERFLVSGKEAKAGTEFVFVLDYNLPLNFISIYDCVLLKCNIFLPSKRSAIPVP
jgi:hypothetical protein